MPCAISRRASTVDLWPSQGSRASAPRVSWRARLLAIMVRSKRLGICVRQSSMVTRAMRSLLLAVDRRAARLQAGSVGTRGVRAQYRLFGTRVLTWVMPSRRAPAQTADMPFTVEQFFEVFRSYNETLWPAQLLLYAPAAAALIGTWKPHRGSHRLVAAALAVLWLWTGVVYHFGFFRTINPAASLFAAISVA